MGGEFFVNQYDVAKIILGAFVSFVIFCFIMDFFNKD